MTDYTKYYRKHYSKYYNHEAIKRHMIEKQIYSPSDFRYYSYQLSQMLNGDTKKSDEMLQNLETKYIQDSIDFLFNDKTNNNESKNTIFQNDIFKIFRYARNNFISDLRSRIYESNDKMIISSTQEEKNTIQNLLRLLSINDLEELKQIINMNPTY